LYSLSVLRYPHERIPNPCAARSSRAGGTNNISGLWYYLGG
jgi:hypothetical protein